MPQTQMPKPSYPIPTTPARYTDIGLLRGWLPQWMHPYIFLLRLDRPTGYWLLVLPAWFSLLLAGEGASWHLAGALLLFLLGAIALRGAGCVINDFWDRELDRRVERTADRPLAAGTISARRALAFFVLLLLLGVFVLAFLPWRVWAWALMSVPLIVAYPLAKRVVPTPQVVLALTFSWGALLGWLTLAPHLSWGAASLYAAAFCWILYYDTIYASQDREDDARMGLHSMPLFLGTRLHVGLCVFAALTIAFWALGLGLSGAGFWAWLGLLGLAAAFTWQLRNFDADAPAACLRQFQMNARYGQIWAVFLAVDLIF